MIPIRIDYATPSVFESDRDRTLVGMSANARRPVRFHGKVIKNIFLLRFALRALGEAIWSDDSWSAVGDWILDPVITVHPDRIFFEAFSQDQSTYAMVIVDPALFEAEGEIRTGTTTVDFTAWLWGALSELRSSRETWLRVGAEGFEVKTRGAGGRFEQKVELPESWVRGFLQLQGAMAMPGTRVTARAIDLLAALRFLRYTKAKMSPRAIRYEFEPDREARIVLEPWEHQVVLKGADHDYSEKRTIRVWGRRRLRLIEPLLPFAQEVDIYLKGRALPSFYAVKLEGITFVLGLSGWTSQRWTETGSFDLLSFGRPVDESLLDRTLELLSTRHTIAVKALAEALGQPREAAARILETLCRRGRVIYDVERREYRHRELFEEPVDVKALYPPDVRLENARAFLDANQVHLESCQPRETRKVKSLKTPEGKSTRLVVYRDWEVTGSVGDRRDVHIVVNDNGRIIFGQCSCDFFNENVLNQGPCEHMIPLLVASETLRGDLPTSTEASADEIDRQRRHAEQGADDEAPDEGDTLEQ